MTEWKWLCHAYATGRMEAYEIAAHLGPQWTTADVIVMLERNGVVRSIDADSNDSFDDVKAWLRDMQQNGSWEEINHPEHIRREVIASQRIEGIDARKHLS